MKTIALAALATLALAGPASAEDLKGPATEPSQAKAEAPKKQEPQISVAGAKSEEQTKARLRADAAVQRCVIKPVMTDEEIQLCTTASRLRREVEPYPR